MDREILWELYERCFPWNVRAEQTVRKVLALPGCTLFTREADGKTAGAALLFENTVLLLCVLPEYRRRGLGSSLLAQCEKQAEARGFEELKFCDGPDYLTPGIPLLEDNESFFTKRGYVHGWGSCECVDMSLLLKDFRSDGHRVGDEINGVLYRWARSEDLEETAQCVEAACPEFAQYYRRKELYGGAGPERVLLAQCGGVICGALQVAAEMERKGVGSVGCTATRPDYQGRGIATNMVRLGTGYLQSLGLEKAFLGYTYTDIVPMYGRSGYQISMKYLMGQKKLKKPSEKSEAI